MEEINAWGAYKSATTQHARSLGRSALPQRRGQRKSSVSKADPLSHSPPSSALQRRGQKTSSVDDADSLSLARSMHNAAGRNVIISKPLQSRSTDAIFFGTDDIGTFKKDDDNVVKDVTEESDMPKAVNDNEQELDVNMCALARDVFGVYFSMDDSHAGIRTAKKQKKQSIFSKISGTMPWLPGYLEALPLPGIITANLLFIEALLRGIAQVFFQNNPLSGVLILVGMFIQSSRIAVHGVLALVAGNLAGILMGFDKSFVSCGLFGYNSFLVGLAIATFYSPDQYYWPVAFGVVVFAYFSSVLFVMIGKILAPYKTPPFTLPFNISTIIFLLATGAMHHVDMASVRDPALPSYGTMDGLGTLTVNAFFAGTIRGIGQVYLANNMISGVLVLVGIMVCSRIAALSAFVGSAAGAAVAVFVGSPSDAIEQGLYGFNPALTMSALLMFYVPGAGSSSVGIIASIITVFVQLALSAFLEPYGLPFMTLPFCLAALAFIVIQGTTSNVISVPLSSMTTPEDHLERVRRLTEGFDLLFSAIRSSSYNRRFKKVWSSLAGFNGISKKMSTILNEYDEEVHGEQEKSCCARLFQFKLKQSNGTENFAREQSFRFSFAMATSIFDDQEKESYSKMFSSIDAEKKYAVSTTQFEAFLRSVGFSDDVGLDFACNTFELLDLDGSGDIDLDEFIAFTKISRHMPHIRHPMIKFFDFVDINEDQSVEISELDSALSYLALPPLRDSEREKISTLCNVNDELEFEVIVNFVTIFKLQSIIREYQNKRKAGQGIDASIHSALTS